MRRLPVFTPKMLMVFHAAELVVAAARPHIKWDPRPGGESRGGAVVNNRRMSAQ